MSFQSDAQRAFKGLETVLKKDFGCEFVQSIPCCAFDLFLLFTGHFNIMKRRKEFPSWTWLGWTGTVRVDNRELLMMLDDCREWLTERTWIIWYYSTPENELKPILSDEESLKLVNTGRHVTYGSRQKFDNKHCPTLDVSNTVPMRRSKREQTDPRRIGTLHFWTLSVLLKISGITRSPHGDDVGARGTIVNANGDFCGSVHLDGDVPTADRLDQPMEFIVLSEACSAMGGSEIENREIMDKSRWDLYWVMLIERRSEDSQAERRGIGQVYQTAVGKALAPSPTWREISLG